MAGRLFNSCVVVGKFDNTYTVVKYAIMLVNMVYRNMTSIILIIFASYMDKLF